MLLVFECMTYIRVKDEFSDQLVRMYIKCNYKTHDNCQKKFNENKNINLIIIIITISPIEHAGDLILYYLIANLYMI